MDKFEKDALELLAAHYAAKAPGGITTVLIRDNIADDVIPTREALSLIAEALRGIQVAELARLLGLKALPVLQELIAHGRQATLHERISLEDAERIAAALRNSSTGPRAEPTDEAIGDFLAKRMTPEGRVPMIATIREALSHFTPAAAGAQQAPL